MTGENPKIEQPTDAEPGKWAPDVIEVDADGHETPVIFPPMLDDSKDDAQ